MADSRDIDDLFPVAAAKCREWLAACEEAGIDVLITATLRSLEESARLYARGRKLKWEKVGKETRKVGIVTNALPGQSFHNWRVAWDAYPRINGAIQWSYDASPEAKALWDKMGAIAAGLGIEWGRNWKSIKDTPHFQFTGGHPLRYFQQGGQL